MNSIIETAAETAKKVRKALKANFPGVKFSVRSSTYSMGSSISVSWTDGPLSEQVDAVLNQFESASFNSMEDYKSTKGYMYEGQLYNGADYVTGSRSLSVEYRQQIEKRAAEMDSNYNDLDWMDQLSLFNDAEKDLMGLTEQFEEEEEIQAVEPVQETKQAEVIDFSSKLAEKQAKKTNDYTPEQKFKLKLLEGLFLKEALDEMLFAANHDIDKVFTAVAINYEAVMKS